MTPIEKKLARARELRAAHEASQLVRLRIAARMRRVLPSPVVCGCRSKDCGLSAFGFVLVGSVAAVLLVAGLVICGVAL